MTREQLINVYLDWRNNFLSVDAYCAFYGLQHDEARALIELARLCFDREHSEV